MDQHFVTLCESLCLLAEPPGKGNNLKAAFEKNIMNVCEKLGVEDLHNLPTLKKFGIKVDDTDIRWKWISLALHIFLSMKECQKEKEVLLSVRQEKAVQSCLEFIISMGVLPSLIPGVGIPLAKRCSSAAVDWVLHGDQDGQNAQSSIIELHERLCAVTKVLLTCIEVEFLQGPILSKHLCDILAALCQLSIAPLKKPRDVVGEIVKDNVDNASLLKNETKEAEDVSSCSSIFSKERQAVKKPVLVTELTGEKNVDDLFIKKNEEFKMTPELWTRFQMERKYFSKVLENLVHDTYQPLVIRDLLLLQGSHDKLAEKGKPAPMWLRRGCANLLNSCLFRKDGIAATVRAICDVFSLPQSNCDNWAQHVILGKLFVMAVKAKKGDDSCCQSICSQVIDLLSPDNLKDSKDYARAGLACISMLWDEEEEICEGYILGSLFPFMSIDQQEDVKSVTPLVDNFKCEEDKVHTDEQKEESIASVKQIIKESMLDLGKYTSIPKFDLDTSLDLIYFCFVENDPGMSLPARLLAPLFPILLRKFQCIKLESNKRSIIKLLLIKFLVGCSDELVLSQNLDEVLFEGSCSSAEVKRMTDEEESCETEDLEGDEEKLLKDLLERHLKTEDLGKPVEEIEGNEELGWGSVPLLELVSSDGGGEAAEVLFRYVLKFLPKGGENSSEHKQGDWLLSITKQSVATKLLCHLLEVPAVSEQVRKHPKDVVTFLGNFLAAEAKKAFGKCDSWQVSEGACREGNQPEKSKSLADDSLVNISGESSFPSFLDFGLGQTDSEIPEKEESKESEEETHSEFVLVALLILKSLCEAGSRDSGEDWWHPLRDVLPQIRAFRRESSCPEVRAMAEDVACAILTKDKVGSSHAPESSSGKGGGLPTKKSAENLPKGDTQKKFPAEDQENYKSRSADSEESKFEMALKMAQENAVHLRGHALIILSKLIKTKDVVALRHKTTLLQLFQENLRHDDSYVYLSAINGLEQLGNIFPDQVLESLADEFAEIGVVKAEDSTFNDVRLKVGEALLRVTRTLGEMAPKYSCLLLNAFLGGVRDGDGLVRASSLSNLGEVCKLLSFHLGSITTEILWCVRCVLETDVAVEARRAAVLVITLLLQGMGVEIFKILETILPEMYRTLKSVRCNDPDEIVQIHAQMALEEVNRITMQFLFPKPTLQKKIFVLDPPS